MKPFVQKIIYHPGFILGTWFIFMFFIVVILPAVSFATFEQGLTESIDTNFSFDASSIYGIIDSYGAQGRAYYIWQRWTFDLVWPLVYSLPLFSTNYRFMPKALIARKLIIALPLIAALFDYLENIVFTILVSLYPIELSWLAVLGVSVSAVKWFALGISMTIVMIFPCFYLFVYIRKMLRQSS